jgi:protein SCO1/2
VIRPSRPSSLAVFAALVAAVVPCGAAPAAPPPGMFGGAEPPAASATPLPAALQVGFDQKLGAQVPLDLEFRDEDGRTVRLGDLFGGRPVVLSLAYYGCPMLCGMSLQGMASSLKTLSFDAGREFEVVTVSFDPRETPAQARARKTQSIDSYGRPGGAQGWRFLTGDAGPIKSLTEAVGFRYVWDEEQKQFAHPTGVVVLTPKGRIARYFFGVEYPPKDLRLGLIEAADERIGTLADRLLLLCYQYDPKTGRYSGLAIALIRAGGILTIAALGLFVAVALRRDRRRAVLEARGREAGA